MTTVDRRKWLAARIAFLESQLEAGGNDAERTAIEAEIESLRKEAGPSRWWRRIIGIPTRPTDR